MCGIAGQIGKEASPDAVRTMTGVLSHRGPDGEGFFSDETGHCHLGHRRLKIIDLSDDAAQPMLDRSGRFAIIFNGEIYNYLELREELCRSGIGFRTASDTEVLLYALISWGEAAIDKLVGMFAFAFYDSAEQSLLLVRDRFGVKPLYYTEIDGTTLFASEIKALLQDSRVPRRVNQSALLDFMQSGSVDHRGGETFFRDVRQIEPGHLLRWRNGKSTFRRYWLIEGASTRPRFEEAVDLVRKSFCDSVRLRLRSDVPVGATLSGGLDSSMIVRTVDEMGETRSGFPLFLCHLRDDPRSEERYAKLVVNTVQNAQPFWVEPTSEEFAADLDALFWHQEEPFSDTSIYAHFCLMREARRQGVPVVLTGQGGDEVFVGYPSYYRAYLGSLIRKGRLIGAAREAFERSAVASEPLANLISGAIYQALPAAIRNRVYRWRMADAGVPLTTAAARQLSTQFDRFNTDDSADDSFDQYLISAIQNWALPHLLHHDDRNSMAFAVESRAPFLDHRLAELLFSLPADYRVRHGWTKVLLREIGSKSLPTEIAERRDKTGFSTPMAKWLRTIRPVIEDVTSEKRWVGDWIDRRRWLARAAEFWAGNDSHLQRVWWAFAVQFWLQRFQLSS